MDDPYGLYVNLYQSFLKLSNSFNYLFSSMYCIIKGVEKYIYVYTCREFHTNFFSERLHIDESYRFLASLNFASA